MAMPKFPYAQGKQFFSHLDAYYRAIPADQREKHYQDRIGELKTKSLRELMGKYKTDKNLDEDSMQHFVADWLEPAGGKSRMFTQVPANDIDDVMREGFCRAFEEALSFTPPLPITTAWFCNAGATTFDVVTLVNPGVTVVALVVTPPPDISPKKHTGQIDTVRVTRHFDLIGGDQDIADIKERLGYMGDPDPKIIDRWGGPASAGEVGTYRIWT